MLSGCAGLGLPSATAWPPAAVHQLAPRAGPEHQALGLRCFKRLPRSISCVNSERAPPHSPHTRKPTRLRSTGLAPARLVLKLQPATLAGSPLDVRLHRPPVAARGHRGFRSERQGGLHAAARQRPARRSHGLHSWRGARPRDSRTRRPDAALPGDGLETAIPDSAGRSALTEVGAGMASSLQHQCSSVTWTCSSGTLTAHPADDPQRMVRLCTRSANPSAACQPVKAS